MVLEVAGTARDIVAFKVGVWTIVVADDRFVVENAERLSKLFGLRVDAFSNGRIYARWS